MVASSLKADLISRQMGKRITEFKLSSHVRRMMADRGVAEEDMIDAVLSPDNRHQQYRGTHGGIVWKFTKEKSSKTLAVVAELYKQTCYIVTTFYEAQNFGSDLRPGKNGAGG